MDKPFVYTDVDSRWARPSDRVRILKAVWAATSSAPAGPRRKVRRSAVLQLLKPTATAHIYVTSGGGSS